MHTSTYKNTSWFVSPSACERGSVWWPTEIQRGADAPQGRRRRTSVKLALKVKRESLGDQNRQYFITRIREDIRVTDSHIEKTYVYSRELLEEYWNICSTSNAFPLTYCWFKKFKNQLFLFTEQSVQLLSCPSFTTKLAILHNTGLGKISRRKVRKSCLDQSTEWVYGHMYVHRYREIPEEIERSLVSFGGLQYEPC